MAAQVYLIGTGPGDPDLLTVKALRLIRRADVIVYDRLVSQAILDLAPPGIERVDVGKVSGHHRVSQARINALLVELAREGKVVARLKGGDPFIFGRGSEEAECLARAGVPYEVVPGITSASGISASARIPLTHRGLATGVRFVTGHCRGDGELALNWASLADPETTLVFYMGLANAGAIARELIAAGRPGATPVAAIENGTRPDERVVETDLAGLEAAIARHALCAPTLLIIGPVVSVRASLRAIAEEALHA